MRQHQLLHGLAMERLYRLTFPNGLVQYAKTIEAGC